MVKALNRYTQEKLDTLNHKALLYLGNTIHITKPNYSYKRISAVNGSDSFRYISAS